MYVYWNVIYHQTDNEYLYTLGDVHVLGDPESP